MRRFRTMFVSSCLVACLLLLAACSLSNNKDETAQVHTSPITQGGPSQCVIDDNNDGFMSEAELTSAVECGTADYQWPPGFTPDAVALVRQQNPAGDTINYQAGYEHTVLSGANQCSWFAYWSDARSRDDKKDEQEALNYITGDMLRFEETVPGFPADLRAGKGGGVLYHLQTIAKQAELGDYSGLTEMNNGCMEVPQKNDRAFQIDEASMSSS